MGSGVQVEELRWTVHTRQHRVALMRRWPLARTKWNASNVKSRHSDHDLQ